MGVTNAFYTFLFKKILIFTNATVSNEPVYLITKKKKSLEANRSNLLACRLFMGLSTAIMLFFMSFNIFF